MLGTKKNSIVFFRSKHSFAPMVVVIVGGTSVNSFTIEHFGKFHSTPI